MSTLNVNQVNTTIMGMTSAMFTSLAATVVTLAVKSNLLVDKSFNVAIHGVSAAENVAEAVEKRSEIYGHGIVANGALAERETTLKHRIRLANLERQESAGPTKPVEPAAVTAPSDVKITSAVPAAS